MKEEQEKNRMGAYLQPADFVPWGKREPEQEQEQQQQQQHQQTEADNNEAEEKRDHRFDAGIRAMAWANRTCNYCSPPRKFLTVELARKHVQRDHAGQPIPDYMVVEHPKARYAGRCPDCGRSDFANEMAVRVHRAVKHGVKGDYRLKAEAREARKLARHAVQPKAKRTYTRHPKDEYPLHPASQLGGMFQSAGLGGKTNGHMADVRDPQFIQVLIMPEADGRFRIWINGLDGTKFRAQGVGNLIINNMAGKAVRYVESDESPTE